MRVSEVFTLVHIWIYCCRVVKLIKVYAAEFCHLKGALNKTPKMTTSPYHIASLLDKVISMCSWISQHHTKPNILFHLQINILSAHRLNVQFAWLLIVISIDNIHYTYINYITRDIAQDSCQHPKQYLNILTSYSMERCPCFWHNCSPICYVVR